MTGTGAPSARFDPARVAELRARTADAVADLREIRSTDSAAGHAMQVIRLTHRTLEAFWVPALDELTRARRDDPSE